MYQASGWEQSEPQSAGEEKKLLWQVSYLTPSPPHPSLKIQAHERKPENQKDKAGIKWQGWMVHQGRRRHGRAVGIYFLVLFFRINDEKGLKTWLMTLPAKKKL